MKRKSKVTILMTMVTMAWSLTGCGERTDIVEDQLIVRNDGNVAQGPCRCGCPDCICQGGRRTGERDDGGDRRNTNGADRDAL